MEKPSTNILAENGAFNLVFNNLAKIDYNKKSDRFNRLVHHENKLLALYNAIDKFKENPFKVTIPGVER